jgi:hypothetical protein
MLNCPVEETARLILRGHTIVVGAYCQRQENRQPDSGVNSDNHRGN